MADALGNSLCAVCGAKIRDLSHTGGYVHLDVVTDHAAVLDLAAELKDSLKRRNG